MFDDLFLGLWEAPGTEDRHGGPRSIGDQHVMAVGMEL
jgi:hypothetical protein